MRICCMVLGQSQSCKYLLYLCAAAGGHQLNENTAAVATSARDVELASRLGATIWRDKVATKSRQAIT